jgi:UDP-glucose 4-epimerase
MPESPVTAYGVAKFCTGRLLGKACELAGIRFVWFRLLAAYGPKDSVGHFIPSLVRDLLARRKPSLTSGDQLWDYLYAEDVADALVQTACRSEASGVFNLGSGEAIPTREIAEFVRDLIDPSLPLGLGEIPYRADQVMRLQADIGKITRASGWRPGVGIKEGLERTVEWHRQENRLEKM